jgi:hypothetical protein
VSLRAGCYAQERAEPEKVSAHPGGAPSRGVSDNGYQK